MTEKTNYLGRLLTESQLKPELQLQAQTLPSIIERKKEFYCNRCDSFIDREEQQLPNGVYYCRECILLGRIRSDEKLFYFPQEKFPKNQVLNWTGNLTSSQAKIANKLVSNYQKKKNSLVHAVTGAGKTEMIYQIVTKVINDGGAVCLASPRIDVCLELYRRFKQDFSCDISLLHGNSDSYFRSPLVIATTHQLLKFYQAFDLMIVDEVDAFPYVDNPVLYHAVKQAVKKEGNSIFLTATSTDQLDKKVRRGELECLSLPKRFHGNPLPIPKKIWLNKFTNYLKKGQIPPKLKQSIANQRKSKFPLLLFIPEIDMGKSFANILQQIFPDENIGFVSSVTENRVDLVEQFRKQSLTILVSTSILERGVTFPCIDVFVVQANHYLFNRSTLIQIAGRVGRSLERPTGELIFFQNGSNHSIEGAIQEIKKMNREAKQ
ncbi:MAG: DEAD/DEAH box helicase [Streptococcus sp.]|nr:DEAD/DEAH box helicase [Streptococcus sp.]